MKLDRDLQEKHEIPDVVVVAFGIAERTRFRTNPVWTSFPCFLQQ